MNELNTAFLIDNLKKKGANRARTIFKNIDESLRNGLLLEARRQTDKIFGKKVCSYIPGSKFPSISVTGTRCELHCLHCNKKYLQHMLPAEKPETLKEILLDLHSRGGEGALISGGSTIDGIVDLEKFYGVLREIKKETQLKLNLHTGLIDKKTAESLYSIGVDSISLDLVGDDETIRRIYHLRKSKEDYIQVLSNLMDAGFTAEQIIPHICIGLYFGIIRGEFEVLNYLVILKPRLLVFIIIIPPQISKGTTFDNGAGKTRSFELVSPQKVSEVIMTARFLYPHSELSLGCMRPGGRIRPEYDIAAFESGVTRIALPSSRFKNHVKSLGYELVKQEFCCALF
ncbi:MAG: radical SAM protein [Promethearchaeota archaeon]